MSRMTLEEKILQTDQYYSGDFTTQDENGKVTAVDMQRFDALMQHNCSILSLERDSNNYYFIIRGGLYIMNGKKILFGAAYDGLLLFLMRGAY